MRYSIAVIFGNRKLCPGQADHFARTLDGGFAEDLRRDWGAYAIDISSRLDTDQMPGLPELDIVSVRRWCEQRVPEHIRNQVGVECDIEPRQLTIVECRPPWLEGTGPEWTRFPIARLHYTQANAMDVSAGREYALHSVAELARRAKKAGHLR